MAMDPRMAQQMQQMMSGMGESQQAEQTSDDDYKLATSDNIDAMDDRLGDGGRDARGNFVHISLDPRLASSRKFGFSWANYKIQKLIKDGDTHNPNFLDDLRFYLMHNPIRGPEHQYIHALLGSAPLHIKPKNRSAAVRLLAEYDNIVDGRDFNNESPAFKAVKLGDLESLTAITQGSNGRKALDYSDSKNHNLLSIAAMHSPELIPFLLRSGVKSVSTNDGMHCVDLALKSFLSTVQYNPKSSFDKLYITLSSLKKAGDPRTLTLLDPANVEAFNSLFRSLPKSQKDCLNSMLSTINNIKSDPNIMFKQRAPLFTNGVRKDKNGKDIAGHAVTYLEGVPSLGALNFDVSSSLFRKTSKLAINVFDYSYTQLPNSPRFTDLNVKSFMLCDQNDKTKLLKSNISFLIKKLDTAMSKTGLLSKLAGTSISAEEKAMYTPMLESLRAMESILAHSNEDTNLFEIGHKIQIIKDTLNKDRMDKALASLIKQTTYEDPVTGKIISGSVNMHNMDLGLPMDNSNGDTLLTFACRNNHMATIDFCLSNDVNLHCVDKYGNTPLHIAAENGNFELINKLIGQFNGNEYEGIHLAKSVASMHILNSEGKTFLDVLHESLPAEKFNKIYNALLEKHPDLKNMAVWDVPFWNLDLAEQQYLENNSPENDALHLTHKPQFALEHADKYLSTNPETLKRQSTNSKEEDNIHYARLKDDMLGILALLQRNDLTDAKKTALAQAFKLRVQNLSIDQQIGFMLESGLSKDTGLDDAESYNLKRDTAARIARNILSEFKGANLQNLDSLTPEQRDILEAFDKFRGSDLQNLDSLTPEQRKILTASDTTVTKIIAGLSVLSMHDNTDRTLETMSDYVESMKKLETYLATAASVKYSDEPSVNNTNGPKPS